MEKDTPHITVREITKNRERRLEREFSAYSKVLDGVYKKIKNCEEMKMNDCLYRVPPFIVGMPVYSHEYAVNFILNQLKDGNFKAYYVGEANIYISWGHCMRKLKNKVEDKNSKTSKFYIKKIVEIPKQQTSGLYNLRLQAEKLKK